MGKFSLKNSLYIYKGIFSRDIYMGLRIEKNNYGYRNDTQNHGEPSVRTKVTNPILHFAMNENPNPSYVEDSEENSTPASNEAPSEETPTTTAAPATEELEETSDEPLTKPADKESEETSDETKPKTTYVFVEWQKLKEKYKAINALPTDKERIIKWRQETAGINTKPYVIVDKASCEATVYSATGEVIDTYEIGIGREKGDEIQLENVVIKNNGKKITIDKAKDSNGKTFETTSAGIYYFSGKANVSPRKGNTYPTIDGYNEYSLEAERGSTGVSINPIPSNHPEQIKKMYNGNAEDNRFTDGDINLFSKDFQRLGKHLKFGTEVFVLPEDSNNKIVVRDGQLNLVQENFTGTVSTSKKPTVVHPIEIDLKPPKPENLGVLGWTKKWTWDVPKRTATWYYEDESRKTKFVKALEDKKADMMENLDIDNDTYNNLATLAIGIANQETKLGQSPKYGWKEGNQWAVKALKWIEGHTFWDVSPYESRGMGQTKLDGYKDADVKRILKEYLDADIEKLLEEKHLKKDTKEAKDEIKKAMASNKLGITPNNVQNPEKSAIATMLVLTSMYKNELPGIKAKLAELKMTWQEAMLYMWQGKKGTEILSGTATPDQNNYVRQAKRFMNERFVLKEVIEAPRIQQ